MILNLGFLSIAFGILLLGCLKKERHEGQGTAYAQLVRKIKKLEKKL